MGWVKPTGYIDSDNKWSYETYVYDNNTGTKTTHAEYGGGWGSFLELTHAALYCTKVRFYAMWEATFVNSIDIDAYYGDAWHDIYQGAYTDRAWVEKTFPAQVITKFRFRFYAAAGTPAWFYEVDFYDATVTPTVTTQAVTTITHNSATGNGNITATGGIVTKRGVCWNTTGNPTIADSKSEETGSFGTGAFTRPITGLDPGVLYYVKAYAYNSAGYAYGGEVNFTTDKVVPTVTTQDATEISQNQVKGNGNITASGGEDATERGFEYGLTQTPTWTKKETAGGYGTGAFSLVIDSLEVNTSYWYRAYAVNSIGTGYGEWVQFQTAASGTIPTGAVLDICADYSGYTYQLHGAETDDGETYESYFVLSTDLTDKQALHFNKRLEDLFSYFKKKESGTCKIYVKRDNEATWQYAGEISMTGDEDILVKHLPSDNEDTSGDVDFFAKTYLIKFVFQNDFEFIGLVTEAIPEGER